LSNYLRIRREDIREANIVGDEGLAVCGWQRVRVEEELLVAQSEIVDCAEF
jgi:hypothetical protein